MQKMLFIWQYLIQNMGLTWLISEYCCACKRSHWKPAAPQTHLVEINKKEKQCAALTVTFSWGIAGSYGVWSCLKDFLPHYIFTAPLGTVHFCTLEVLFNAAKGCMRVFNNIYFGKLCTATFLVHSKNVLLSANWVKILWVIQHHVPPKGCK